MAIVVIVKNFKGLKSGKGDRFVKIDFRGVSHYSSCLEETGDFIEVNQSFTWNFGRAVEEIESLQLDVVTRGVLRNEKTVARYGLILQSVVRDGRVSITDALVDLNNKPLAAIVSFEIRYEAPDGSLSSYATTEILQDERQMLIDIEENIANLERSLANREAKNGGSSQGAFLSDSDGISSRMKNLVQRHRRISGNTLRSAVSGRSTKTEGNRERKISTLKTMRSFMKLGKQRPSRTRSREGASDCSETRGLVDSSCDRATSSNLSRAGSSVTSLDSDISSDRDLGGLDNNDEDDDDTHGRDRDSDRDVALVDTDRRDGIDRKNGRNSPVPASKGGHESGVDHGPTANSGFSLKAQHYQVCITIIEARQLAGLNMDPVVCVQIGDQRKYTSVKESTNCPYYNEYFVFDFHMPPVMLLDKIITLSVQQSRNLLRANLTLGSFKLDVATVWAQPDHQFYHKWALLTDPEDVVGGPKGYLKCDISVIGKGDSVKIPGKGGERDEDDIEGNLLLPDGAPIERQRARFIVKIFRADGLPKMNSSVMANVKKAFTGRLKDLVDPYVRVSFAGLSGKTSVKRNSYAPVWNEQVTFTEMFPPLCQRIKIQLCDDDPVNGSVIGTHFIDLKEISNDGEKGFLPTFGPAFVHLYGSTRDYSIVDQHATLNTGLGEGVSYRARLLIAIRTEMSDNADNLGCVTASDVEITQTIPANETAYATNEEFLLFATVMDAVMIDKKLGEKPMYFEISIGNAGNTLDGHNESSKIRSLEVTKNNGGVAGGSTSPLLETTTDDSSFRETIVCAGGGSWRSTTQPAKPMTHDRLYYFLPYWDDKPCLHVRSVWPDYRRRMYHSNIIGKIIIKLEEGLAEVDAHEDDPKAEKMLKSVLEDLSAGCNRYVNLSKSSATGGPGLGKTKLDKERIKLCQRELENIGTMARHLKAIVTKNSFNERLKTARTFVGKLKFLLEDPQQSLPDVFVWVISSGRRVAYHRMPARDLIYSIVDEESGRYCATVQNMFLKLPGKKGLGTSGWTVQAKLRIYMWLGILKHKKYLIQGLPKGYEMSNELKNIDKPRAQPPSTIHYVEKHKFQLRAHMYQARSLIGSDASGLSDPFARVICGEYSKTTQVIDETLSPTWDELLIIDDILIYGTNTVIKKDPPTVVVELFDRDKVGKSEYIGRTVARTHVKLVSDVYGPPEFPPSLEWYRVTRGLEPAGELLAVFELLEYTSPGNKRGIEPKLPEPKIYQDNDIRGSPRRTSAGNTTIGAGQDEGPVFPVPAGIRPTLSKYRIEVLFWGLRDLKRIHLLSVDKPRVDVECAGHILHSSVISNAKKNPNFSTPIKFIQLELPDQELYRPPVTIRAVDCRSFGRYTLVGTHTISSIQKYMHREPGRSRIVEGHHNSSAHAVSLPEQDFCNFDPESTIISLGLVRPPVSGPESKREKMQLNLRRKESLVNSGGVDSEDHDSGTKDWWTKYFASVEASMEAVVTESRGDESTTNFIENRLESKDLGSLSIARMDGNGFREKGATGSCINADKSPGQSSANKSSLLFISGGNAAKFVAKLSPKNLGHKRGEGDGGSDGIAAIPSTEKKNIALMKIYRNELEAQPDFDHFREWLHTFELYRGKKTGDDVEDSSRIVGSFKGSLKVYKWSDPTSSGCRNVAGISCFNGEERSSSNLVWSFDPQFGFFQSLPVPSNEPIHVLVRIYIVKANDLHPCDPNGKADPYVVLHLGDKRISDKDNYVSKQLNPVFGKCFEIEATFPQDSLLTVQILDWDLVGADDMIGETKIDLENRFYSKHRATCGIARRYDEFGYNKWRDPMKPTQILLKLCKDAKLDAPNYSHGRVAIGKKTFTLSNEEMQYYVPTKGIEEHLALAVLHRWDSFNRIGTCLIPEHVESRPLYNPDKPGIEQGRLDMWVDMFPMDMPLPGPPIDISPRKPKGYELRVIIWNTEDVVLEDDAFFTGEKMSDIYVKGWLKGSEDCQCTDIHYRSLTGEGNFNWRFIFPFEYLVAEERIVINRKESLFSWDETEFKIPARLELQVWDADHFSADDFLGAITLDLNRFPRGAKNSKLCNLGMVKTDGSVPAINIFKQKRVKGWWPFYVKKENEDMELTGKVEAEIHLLTKEEAETNPAGHGRNEPDPLDKPSRPDASFVWLLNPIKSIKYIIWHNYKWPILKAILVVAIAFLLLLFFYAIPGYSVKKILGA